MKNKNKIIEILLKLSRRKLIYLTDKKYLELKYLYQTYKKIYIDNPQTFNEKLQWLKLYDRKRIYTTMVDKYEVKKYVSEKLGENCIIPTLGIYDKWEDINFNKLPNQFVIKCTHDSGGVAICKNKKEFDFANAKNKIEKSLKRNYFYAGREWPYKNVRPRILIEKYMEDESGYELKDYKIFCFNGEPKFIQLDYDRFTNHHRNIYDTKWKMQPFNISYSMVSNKEFKKPIELEKMIEYAKKISINIPFARCDFYIVRGCIYFGEITFYPESGFGKFVPEEWNLKLGEMLELPNEKSEKNEK